MGSVQFRDFEHLNITTGSGGDQLTGEHLADELHSGSGADTLTGGQGPDTLDGGAGLDTASYADSTTAVSINLGL